MKSLDKFRGSLIGLALGDALGAPLEGMKAGRVKDVYGLVRGFVDPQAAWKSRPYHYRPVGVYTDDTQQSLCLAESLIRCYGFNADDFARTLLKLWQAGGESRSGAFRGIGPVFKKAMNKLAAGAKPQDTGEPSAGIGASMRAAPAGLYFCDDREALLKASIEQALLTHKDPRAIALSACVAYAVARSAGGDWDALKPGQRAQDLIEFAAEAEKIIATEYLVHLPPLVYEFFGLFYRSIEPFRHWHGMEHELVLRQIVNLANQAFPPEKINSPAQNFALAAGVTALFIAITSRDFSSGALEAINLGRATDSAGAMTGAILGGRFGESAMPGEWKDQLKNCEQIGLRAEALYQKSFAGLKLGDLKKMELKLTVFENQEREKFVQKMIAKGEYDPEAIAKKAEAKKEKKELGAAVKKIKHKAKEGKRRREKAPWRRWED